MSISEKIKRVRTFRGMTQKELADKLGLGEKGANRIAQYEMGYRTPKKDMLNKMAEIFDIHPYFLENADDDGGLMEGSIGGIMESLFWLDEVRWGALQLITFQRSESRYSQIESKIVTYDDNRAWPPYAPTGLWFRESGLDSMMREWAIRKEELLDGKITRDEYFEWKLQWPLSCDDCGQHEPERQWRKIKEEKSL